MKTRKQEIAAPPTPMRCGSCGATVKPEGSLVAKWNKFGDLKVTKAKPKAEPRSWGQERADVVAWLCELGLRDAAKKVESGAHMSKSKPKRSGKRAGAPVPRPLRASVPKDASGTALTEQEATLMRHALGLDRLQPNRSKRNYFCASGDNITKWRGLVSRGFAAERDHRGIDEPIHVVFYLTAAGVLAVARANEFLPSLRPNEREVGR